MSGISVLVAEDNELWRNFIGWTLRIESSFEIIEVVDGVQAVVVAERRRPTIALLDLGLPRLNGLDAARGWLKKNNSSRKYNIH